MAELEQQEGTHHAGSSSEAKVPKRGKRGRWAGPVHEGPSQPIREFGFFGGMVENCCNLGRGMMRPWLLYGREWGVASKRVIG